LNEQIHQLLLKVGVVIKAPFDSQFQIQSHSFSILSDIFLSGIETLHAKINLLKAVFVLKIRQSHAISGLFIPLIS
jgi:hypothetical protein